MYHLQILPLTCLLASNFPFISTVQPAEKKVRWQKVSTAGPEAKLDGGFSSGADYGSRDIGGYSAGTEYPSGSIGNYGSSYGSSFDGNMHNNGFGGDVHGEGFGGTSHSESFSGPSESFSSHSESFSGPSESFSGHSESFSGHSERFPGPSESYSGHGDGFGGGLQNGGWEKPVKTIVKHVYKNVAVPHAVPAPVSVPVPRYFKYFKPFAIAKPVGVPHVIPVIKHIQKPIPFFTALPIQHTVPVPKFVGLPVQVRVPRPVFIHVPKIVPVAKKYPVPVEVNIPKPYIVPIYKHVPVPVPHRVPKIINIIKEVPHYVKKPVPVYVDDHSNDYGGGGNYPSSGYNNDYGNDYQGAYGNQENPYGGSHSGSHHQSNSYNNMAVGYNNNGGNDYNQYQNFGNTQDSNQYNSPYFYNNQKGQNQNHQKIYPSNSYPRAHRLPNKPLTTKLKDSSDYHSVDGSNVNNHGSTYELNVEVKQNGEAGISPNYNKEVQPANNQLQTSTASVNYYQSSNDPNKLYNTISSTGHESSSFDPLTTSSNSGNRYSQPVYNPSSYAEYSLSQQQNNQQGIYQQNNSHLQYSQPSYSEAPPVQTTTNPGMLTEASKSFANYQQYPSNSYNSGYSDSQQSNSYNNIPHQDQNSNYNNAKSPYPSKSNFDFTSFYKQPATYQSPQTSPWESNINFHTSNYNSNKYTQPQEQNKQASYPQPSSQNNFGYEKDNSNFGGNPVNSYDSVPNGYHSLYPANSNQNNNYNTYDGYLPSGSSFSTNSYSNSYSQSQPSYQNEKNNKDAYKQNEKYDQSSSQNSYSTTANVNVPGLFKPSGTSYSSSASYSNDYGGNNGFSSQETRQISAAVPPNGMSGSTLNVGSPNPSNSYSNYQGYSSNSQEVNQPISNANGGMNGQIYNIHDNPASHSSGSNYLNSPSYSSQEIKQGQGVNNDVSSILNYGNNAQQTQQNDLLNFVNSNANSYSQPASDTPGYTSSSYSNSNSFSMTPESSYQPEIYGTSSSQLYNSNVSQDTAFSTNHPIISSPDVTTSFSYNYNQQESNPAPAYTGSPLYSSSYASNDGKHLQFSQPQPSNYQSQNNQAAAGLKQSGAQQDSSAFKQKTDQHGLSSATSNPFQGFNTKLDEMEQHMQSSGSSIINVYTNSPDSKEAKKGQTFTFVDPASLESSQSSKYYLPPDSMSGKKSKYSNSDLQIVQAPSFNHDPNEPLQTSLDAYVPAQPVYYPPTNDQNTVYKEAMTVTDTVYKEAISLNSDTKKKSR